MIELTADWTCTQLVAAYLEAGFARVTGTRLLDTFPHIVTNGGKVTSLTLHSPNGLSLHIQNHMVRIAERIEVGVLLLDDVEKLVPSFEVALPPAYLKLNKMTQLNIEESGYRAASGLQIYATDGTRLLIIASVYPYAMSVRLDGHALPFDYEPEYDETIYTERPYEPQCL